MAIAIGPAIVLCAALSSRRGGRVPVSVLAMGSAGDPSGGGIVIAWLLAWPVGAVVLGAVPLIYVARGTSLSSALIFAFAVALAAPFALGTVLASLRGLTGCSSARERAGQRLRQARDVPAVLRPVVGVELGHGEAEQRVVRGQDVEGRQRRVEAHADAAPGVLRQRHVGEVDRRRRRSGRGSAGRRSWRARAPRAAAATGSARRSSTPIGAQVRARRSPRARQPCAGRARPEEHEV